MKIKKVIVESEEDARAIMQLVQNWSKDVHMLLELVDGKWEITPQDDSEFGFDHFMEKIYDFHKELEIKFEVER